ASCLPAAYDVGRRQHPTGVAYSRHHLPRAVHLADEIHHALILAKEVRGPAARYHHGVKIRSFDIPDGSVRDRGIPFLAGVSLPCLGPDRDRFRAILAEA